ncbi:MAG: hypothetical protein ACP5FH_07140 [Terracidiphilus sp.]
MSAHHFDGLRIRCRIGPQADLFHLGQTLAGLYAQPRARVRLRCAAWITNPVCAALEIEGLKVAIELSDHADFWDGPLLDWCDVYAKRSLTDAIAPEHKCKIVPFGLNWACHSRRSAFWAVATMGAAALAARRKEIYRYLVTPLWKDFEYSPEEPTDDTILFQTRVWEPQEAPGDEGINEQRIALLRALRSQFGHRVVGGVVPTAFARKICPPELITDQPSRQPQFIRWAKRPLIGIYTRGLFGSAAFKMAEYLAASKCIAGEKIDGTVGVPPPVLPCSSIDEHLAVCDRLLSSPSLARSQRRQSWEYYRARVAPPAHLADLLRRCGVNVATPQEPAV